MTGAWTNIEEDTPIINFLKDHYVKKSDKKQITHQMLPGLIPNFNTYTFHIPNDEYDTLIKLYHTHIFEHNFPLSLMEVIGDVSPMFLDIDIKYDNTDNTITEKQYTMNTIQQIIKMVSKKVCEYLIIDNLELIKCIVMEKDNIIFKKEKNGQNIAKDGIHVIFPQLVLHKKLQKHLIADLCKEGYSDDADEIFATFKTQPIINDNTKKNKLDVIMDESIYKNGKMVMLGSIKPDNIPYKVTKVFNINKDDYEITEDGTIHDSYSLLELNSLYNCPDKQCKYFDDTQELIDGVGVSPPLTTKQITTQSIPKTGFNIGPSSEEMNAIANKNPLIESNKEICEKLVDCFSINRAEDYNSWINVGICLFNISNDHKLLEIWKDFSKKSSKYTEGVCEKNWLSNFKNNNCSSNLTISSLYYWAGQDNLDKFKKSRNSLIKTFVEKSLHSTTHSQLARVVFKAAPHDFVCAAIKEKEWFVFNRNTTRWESMDGAVNLRQYIKYDITEIFYWYQGYYKKDEKMKEETGNMMGAKTSADYSKACVKVQKELETVTFKENVIKECRDEYYDKEFLDKLDANTKLVGFDNCIFDLGTGMFRYGEPNDYVSKSCGITINLYKNDTFPISINDYYKTLKTADDFNNDNYQLSDFLEKILPIKSVRDYTLLKIASCLVGDIREEKFHIWTGSGGNGKSKLTDLIEKCFGDYSCKLPVSILTQKRGQSSGANPELARTRGIRYICMQEPDINENINIGLMKELTGGDTITARGLYKSCQDFKPQFTLFLMCNQLPPIPGDDDGTWRRIEVVEYISKFRENVKDGDEKNHIYKADLQLNAKLDKWTLPFIIKLLYLYCNVYNRPTEEGGGIIVPEEVTKQTRKYRANNDRITQFMDEFYELSEDKDHTTTIAAIRKDFTGWWKDQFDKKSTPSQSEFDDKIKSMQKDSKYGVMAEKNNKNVNFVDKTESDDFD